MHPSLDSKVFDRGAELSHKTVTHIPKDDVIRPLRDVILIEPIGDYFSSIITVISDMKPLKGIVRAVGPGLYPRKYNGPKGVRTKTWLGRNFRATEVKVGDVVEFGGIERGGIPFQTLYWGDTLMLVAREEDVCFIRAEEKAA